MQAKKIFAIQILSFLLITLFGHHPSSFAKSSKQYSLDSIYINAEICSDGCLQIEESRSYRFKGSFSWADYSIPL